MRNYGKLAYEAYMKAKGGHPSDAEWRGYDSLSRTEQQAWDDAAAAVSDATRGWIQTRIAGLIENE